MKSFLLKHKGRVIFVIILLLFLLYFFIYLLNPLRTLLSVKQIGDSEFYELYYFGSYKFDRYLKIGSTSDEEYEKTIRNILLFNSSGRTQSDTQDECSAFSAYNEKGEHIVGRNLDLENANPALLLYANPTHGYSSVTMVNLGDLGLNDNEKLVSNNLFEVIRNRLNLLAAPYVPHDGMNEKGLVVATLNVPFINKEMDENKITIQRWAALRLMLDHAATVDEAVDLLKEYNVFDGEVHFFIADASGNSAVVEFYQGEMKVIKNIKKYQAVTNFVVASSAKYGDGQDRYENMESFLQKNNGVISDIDAMNLLKQVSASTVWSAVYNQTTGKVEIALRKQYDDIKTFSVDLSS